MPSNVILLTVDALRADHLSCYGYSRETTPEIDRFADDAIEFERAYSASSHTREAVPALLTGLHPPDAVSDGFSKGAEIIPQYLPDEYATAAFHSNPYVSRAYGYDEGFDHFDDDLRLGQNRFLALIQRALDKFVFSRGEYHARAEEINDKSLSWLDSVPEDQPFFLWNHYMDVHGPYNPPEGYGEWSEFISNGEAQELYDRLSGSESPDSEDVQIAVDLYDGEIRYVDEYIGRFLSKMEKRGLLADSVVILTSDHGDLFGEYGRYAHPRYVYPELTHVPLLVSGSNIESGVVEKPTSTLDLLPAILNLADEDVPENLVGDPISRPDELSSKRLVYSSATGQGSDSGKRRFGIQGIDWGYRLTRNQDIGKVINEEAIEVSSWEVVDMETLDSETRQHVSQLRDQLLTHGNRWAETPGEGDEGPTTNTEIEERLDALGYR